MSKSERTEVRRFASRYAMPGEQLFVRDDQYLAETIISKRAAHEKRHLPARFWQDKAHALEFRKQLKHAVELLKLYPVMVILEALKDRRAYKVFSLGAKFLLIPICDEILKKNSLTDPGEPGNIQTELPSVDERPREAFAAPGKNLRSKLRELD